MDDKHPTGTTRLTNARGTAGRRPTTFLARFAVLMSVTVAATVVGTPTATADSTATLAQQIAGKRAGCPPLQTDPVLTALAQRANRETQQYQQHLARFEPFEDAMPALKSLGYATSKARLLPGYGDTDQKAIDGVLIFGWEAIPDCSYTKYGVDVLTTDTYTLAATVIAAPPA